MTQAKKKAKSKAKKTTRRYWSARVTRESDAMDLEGGVFRIGSAKSIAQSLKRSAEHSHRRKSAPFRSAMSMLTFYVNRAGANLPATRLRILDQAKEELRKLYEQPAAANKSARKRAAPGEEKSDSQTAAPGATRYLKTNCARSGSKLALTCRRRQARASIASWDYEC